MSPVTSGSSIISFENDCLSHDSLPRSVIICEDSDQLINLIASQEGVDVTDETEEGTNAIDVDSLPHLPLNAPPPQPQPVPAASTTVTGELQKQNGVIFYLVYIFSIFSPNSSGLEVPSPLQGCPLGQ